MQGSSLVVWWLHKDPTGPEQSFSQESEKGGYIQIMKPPHLSRYTLKTGTT